MWPARVGRGGVGEVDDLHARGAEQDDVGEVAGDRDRVRVAAEGAGDGEALLALQGEGRGVEEVEGVEGVAVEEDQAAVAVDRERVGGGEGEVGGELAGPEVEDAEGAGAEVGGGDGEAGGVWSSPTQGATSSGGVVMGGPPSLSLVLPAVMVSSPVSSPGMGQASSKLAARTGARGRVGMAFQGIASRR
jgi:hypothetical protein